MRYRFYLVCPNCGEQRQIVADKKIPQPNLSCGNCLMGSARVFDFKVLKVEKENDR